MSTISINEIESTKAFQGLNKIQQSFAVKRKNREILTNALIVHRTTNVIPATVFGYNLAIVEEMIIGELAKIDHKFGGEGNKIENLEWVPSKNNESAN